MAEFCVEFLFPQFVHAFFHVLSTPELYYLYLIAKPLKSCPMQQKHTRDANMPVKHEAIIRRYYHDLFCAEKMDVSVIDQYTVDGFVAHDLRLAQEGRQGYKRFISMLATSFSDMHHLVIRDIFSSSDKVVARWSWTGKHSAEFMGIPATNRPVTLKGIDIFQLTEEKISNLWQEIDFLGILQQISAPPADGAHQESVAGRN
jgi:predicted ester cyclase